MTSQDGASRPLQWAALLVFALSGCSGLIYQSIWSHYLGLYLGHAAYAQSLVLAIFMGGMALGAWWASRSSLHWRNLLRAYALIELIIGIAGALFHPTYVGLTGFAYDTAFPNLPGSVAVQAFKWGSGALLILPQSILLGMTFPLMSSGLMRRMPGSDGATLGGLYFSNSIGAAGGALLATFVLLPIIGLPGAMRVGAILNIVVALLAFMMSRDPEPRQSGAAVSGKERVSGLYLLLGAAFITGATSFVYEIGWVRMLSLVFGSTVHAFELMLAAFIGGLAFGGLWIRRRIDGYASPLRVGGWVQILMGLAALLSLILYDSAFDWVAWFMRALSRTDGGYDLYNTVTAVVSILLMAPAAFFAGMTLPLFTLALIRAGGGEAAIGRIYAANTVGAIVGVFAAVHLLVPLLGLKLAMIAAAAGDLVLGLVLLRQQRASARTFDKPYLGALALCGAALAVTVSAARFDPSAMAGGVYRSATARLEESRGQKIIYYRDGKTASVAMREASTGLRSITTNGKVDAGINMQDGAAPAPDETTMVMASILPLLHHPAPRSAAVIGFGSGLSTHTLLGDPRLERVDTIEIEPAMIEAARLFGKHVERAYTDPRSHLHIEDARTYFAAHRSRYDIIMSEPSNPWVSGVASLFSREFYEFIPHHLAPGGLFVQWVQLYEINDELVASVANALSDRFTDYRIYLGHDNDMLIVASADGSIPDIATGAAFPDPLHSELSRLGISTTPEVLAHQLGDKRSLTPLFRAASNRVNSDYYPMLSLHGPRARFTNQSAAAIYNMPVADLPYREVLSSLPPPHVEQVGKIHSRGFRASVHNANRLALALLGRQPLDAAGGEARQIAYLRTAVGQCQSQDEERMIDALIQMAGYTAPFLGAEARAATWDAPAWIQCTTQPERVQRVLTAMAALARGDGKTLQLTASGLLADDKPLQSAAARDWLLRAATLGAVMQGDYATVEQLEQTVGTDIRSAAPADAYRLWVRNYARQRLQEAEASRHHRG